jgi:beta-glucosidase/6-phospho-beta-glucosidase/beta-galactosidase
MEGKSFFWGVATSGYQVEGGFNRQGEPRTNWALAEEKGEVEPLGDAAHFWSHYEADLDRCLSMGLSAFRLSIEWSRVQPSFHPGDRMVPDFDQSAIERYARLIGACFERGLEPIVTLHHFVHPDWLKADPWLHASIRPAYHQYVEAVLTGINEHLLQEGHPVIRYLITINEPNMLVLNTYLGAQFPSHAHRTLETALRAINGLLVTHIEAYNRIHDLYERQGWEKPMVTLNNYCSDVYWFDKGLMDLLASREKGILPNGILPYLQLESERFESSLQSFEQALHLRLTRWLGRGIRSLIHALARRKLGPESFREILVALNDSQRVRVFDLIAIDYYDPFCAHIVRFPSFDDLEFKSATLRSWLLNAVSSKWWDWRALPKGLRFFCETALSAYPDRDLLIAENGMALRRRRDNQHSHRRDRLTRSEFLAMHVAEVRAMLEAGWPLLGYLHWSLLDNYEWGTFSPRFGLFSLDYEQGSDRLATDHLGDCPSETYADLIRSFEVSGSQEKA